MSGFKQTWHDTFIVFRMSLYRQHLFGQVKTLNFTFWTCSEIRAIDRSIKDNIPVHLLNTLYLIRIPLDWACSGLSLLTSVSFPNSFFPASVRVSFSTEISHPASLLPTRAPSARARIWCPKQIPTTGFLCVKTVSRMLLVRLRIHWSSAQASCSTKYY